MKVAIKATKKLPASERVLLNRVSATAKHGEILAIVGPSGAGKSTFLDAVAGRINFHSLQGSIRLNGRDVDQSFKRRSGYVMQDDALFPVLTVRETLLFSASLRLPGYMAWAEKVERVDSLIEELALHHCINTKIGNEEIKGVSGGERRRVSIGVDLIHDPAVIFLDEPTSGLDSSSALNVMQILADIAEQGRRTVVLTIHQPSFRIIDLIHNLLILAHGHAVYHGACTGLKDYLSTLGEHIPAQVNMLEYVLDLIEDYQDRPGGLQALKSSEVSKERAAGFWQGPNGACMPVLNSFNTFPLAQKEEKARFATSFLHEIWYLSSRNAKNQSRTRDLFFSRLSVMVVMGLTMGSLFFNAGFTTKGIRERNALFSFTVALIMYNSMDALPIFLQERDICLRELSRGAYRPASYVLSSTLTSLPTFVALSLALSGCTYFLASLDRSVPAFSFFLLICFLTFTVANAWVTMWSAIAPTYYTSNSIVAASFSYFFLFCGYFLPRGSIPRYWIWMHYANLFKYPLEGLMWNEYSRLGGHCFNRNAVTHLCTKSSSDVLKDSSLGKVNFRLTLCVMVAFALAFRCVFYTALLRRSRAVRN
eukprot:SM000027S09568  [mRNA]  locus=s27:52714:57126:- [translate_table: standard]